MRTQTAAWIAMVSLAGGFLIGRATGPQPIQTPPGAAAARAPSAPLAAPPAARSPAPLKPGTIHEDFQQLTLPAAVWKPDDPARLAKELPEDAARYADHGAYFVERLPGFAPPQGYRLAVPLGREGALTLESYSRSEKALPQLISIVEDPGRPGNRVLKIASPEHTDGTVLRSSAPLSAGYRACAKVGFINFGTGDGANGYDDAEGSGPWLAGDATAHNTVVFGAVYRAVPRPYNSVLSHHLQLAAIGSDNNLDSASSIWAPDLGNFFPSGWHPVVIAAADGGSPAHPEGGPPVFTFAGQGWNAPGEILAADAYQEGMWYTACIARRDAALTLSIEGDFRYGGRTTYTASLPGNQLPAHGEGPHYWLLGDPRINFSEGSLLVDDVTITVDPRS